MGAVRVASEANFIDLRWLQQLSFLTCYYSFCLTCIILKYLVAQLFSLVKGLGPEVWVRSVLTATVAWLPEPHFQRFCHLQCLQEGSPVLSVRMCSEFLLITNLTHFFQCIYLFHFPTCFEQASAHHQENQLYQYIIWYISLCVGDCLVCRRSQHTRQSPAHSDIYQMMYWYNWFSWWWALACSKHVEKWNKHFKKGGQVGC